MKKSKKILSFLLILSIILVQIPVLAKVSGTSTSALGTTQAGGTYKQTTTNDPEGWHNIPTDAFNSDSTIKNYMLDFDFMLPQEDHVIRLMFRGNKPETGSVDWMFLDFTNAGEIIATKSGLSQYRYKADGTSYDATRENKLGSYEANKYGNIKMVVKNDGANSTVDWYLNNQKVGTQSDFSKNTDFAGYAVVKKIFISNRKNCEGLLDEDTTITGDGTESITLKNIKFTKLSDDNTFYANVNADNKTVNVSFEEPIANPESLTKENVAVKDSTGKAFAVESVSANAMGVTVKMASNIFTDSECAVILPESVTSVRGGALQNNAVYFMPLSDINTLEVVNVTEDYEGAETLTNAEVVADPANSGRGNVAKFTALKYQSYSYKPSKEASDTSVVTIDINDMGDASGRPVVLVFDGKGKTNEYRIAYLDSKNGKYIPEKQHTIIAGTNDNFPTVAAGIWYTYKFVINHADKTVDWYVGTESGGVYTEKWCATTNFYPGFDADTAVNSISEVRVAGQKSTDVTYDTFYFDNITVAGTKSGKYTDIPVNVTVSESAPTENEVISAKRASLDWTFPEGQTGYRIDFDMTTEYIEANYPSIYFRDKITSENEADLLATLHSSNESAMNVGTWSVGAKTAELGKLMPWGAVNAAREAVEPGVAANVPMHITMIAQTSGTHNNSDKFTVYVNGIKIGTTTSGGTSNNGIVKNLDFIYKGETIDVSNVKVSYEDANATESAVVESVRLFDSENVQYGLHTGNIQNVSKIELTYNHEIAEGTFEVDGNEVTPIFDGVKVTLSGLNLKNGIHTIEANDYTASFKVDNGLGFVIDTFEIANTNGQVALNLTGYNHLPEEKSFYVIMCAYSEENRVKRLEDAKLIPITVSGNSELTTPENSTLTYNASYEYKTFMWNDLENIKPLRDFIEL